MFVCMCTKLIKMLRFTMFTNSTIGRYLIGKTMNKFVEHDLDNIAIRTNIVVAVFIQSASNY